MSEWITEEFVLGALSRYGDAIEHSVTIDASHQHANAADTDVEIGKADIGAMSRSPHPGHEVAFDPMRIIESETEDRKRALTLAGVLVAAAVVILAAVFAVGDTSSTVDTTPAEATSDTARFTSDSLLGPPIIGFGQQGTIVVTNGEFVSLGRDATGLIIARSTDGIRWTTTAVSDAPDGASPRELTQTEDGWLAVFEIWPEVDASANRYFSNGPQPQRLLATSPDLLTWDSVALPAFTELATARSFVQGVAISDATVAVLGSVSIGEANERDILLSSGAATETELTNYCGTYEFLDGDFVAYSCAIEEQMFDEIDEDELNVTSETTDLTEFELLRIGPGDVGFEPLNVLAGFGQGGFDSVHVVLAGPFDGPFERTELDVGDFNVFLAGSDQGFVAAGVGSIDRSQLIRSTDGVAWSEPQLIRNDYNLTDLAATQSRITAVGQISNDPAVAALVSEDFGQTWSESVLPMSLDFLDSNIGPAGVSVRAVSQPIGEIEIEKDGFTMIVDQATFDAGLLGPAGDVIFDVGTAHVLGFGSQDPAESVRYVGELGEPDLVWLEPATGNDLVTFTFENFDEAQSSHPTVVETETWFSSDSVDWALLERSERSVADWSLAVGNDGVLLRTVSDPPANLLTFRLESRAPSSAEIAALEAWYEDDGASWELLATE